MTLKSTIIPRKVRVFSATYANLPTTGLVEEDLGYATDRLVLYRWDGSAWVAITIHSSAGLAADIPTAADLPNGSIYHETDTDLVKMVEAGAWVTIAQPASNLTVAETEVYNAAAPTAWTDLNLSGTVGSQVTLVLLKIDIVGGFRVAVRRNGDTDDPYILSDGASGIANVDVGNHAVLMVTTDSNGIIEWMSENSGNTTIDVIAFIA